MKKTKYFILVKGIQRLRYIFSSNECDLSFTAFIKLTLKHPFCARYYSWDFLLLLPWIFFNFNNFIREIFAVCDSPPVLQTDLFFPLRIHLMPAAAYNY